MKLSIRELVLFSILGSVLTIGQIGINFLPNIEIVSFLIIIYGLVYGKKALYSVFIFVILEGFFYGIGPWWIGYLIIWPLLLVLTIILNRWLKKDMLRIAIFSGIFGLIFGALFALPYVLFGNITYAFTFWINGFPFDLIHMVSNYFLMLFGGKSLYKLLNRLNNVYSI